MRKLSYALGALIAAVLMAGVLVATIQPAQAQSFPRFPVGWLLAQRLTVSTITTLTGNVTTGADVTVGGDLVVNGFTVASPAPVITYTTGQLTPLSSVQPVVVTSTRALTNVAVLPAGTLVEFYNPSTAVITFTDSAPLLLSGNCALGQHDVLIVRSNGTGWRSLACINN